jgi:opacity protein-like surface antigen
MARHTARPRGYARERVSFYGTGGAALAGTAVRVCNLSCFGDWQNRTGWAARVDIEYAAWDHVTMKVEYLHADFGSGTYINPSILTPTTQRSPVTLR